MAHMVGTIPPFDCQSQSWEEYCEILQHFFEANEITKAVRQKAILLSSVGSQTYSLLRNLLSPVKPGTKTFGELVELLKEHFNPKPSEILQRFKFNSRAREDGEMVLEYVAVLRKLAHDCNYGEKLTEMLRDRLVCGINEDRIQRRLLAETHLTFEKALKIAQAMETANKDVKDLQSQRMEGSSSLRVHKTTLRQDNEKCHKCGKQGHLMKVCRTKTSVGEINVQRRGKPTDGEKTHYASKEENNDTECDEVGMFTVYSLQEIEIPKIAPLTIKLQTRREYGM